MVAALAFSSKIELKTRKATRDAWRGKERDFFPGSFRICFGTAGKRKEGRVHSLLMQRRRVLSLLYFWNGCEHQLCKLFTAPQISIDISAISQTWHICSAWPERYNISALRLTRKVRKEKRTWSYRNIVRLVWCPAALCNHTLFQSEWSRSAPCLGKEDPGSSRCSGISADQPR